MKTTLLSAVSFGLLSTLLSAGPASAQPVTINLGPNETFVQASPSLAADGSGPIAGGNTAPSATAPVPSPAAPWFDTSGTLNGQGLAWFDRSPWWATNISGFYNPSDATNSNLTTTIAGLDASKTYQVGFVAWDYYPSSVIAYSAGIEGNPMLTFTGTPTPYETLANSDFLPSPPNPPNTPDPNAPTGQGNYLVEYNLGNISGISTLAVDIAGNSFGYVGLTYTPVAVPEPSSLALAGIAAASAFVAARRKLRRGKRGN